MKLEMKPRQSVGLISRTMEDGTVIVSPIDGRMNVVNDVGAIVWELSDGQHTVAAIIEQVTSHFDVPAEQAQADVYSFLQALQERQLIIWETDE